ncbi:MAG: DUF58 domain-containing protein [Deltaproteobacteria bacterium]|nr:DUF58 domain-containing protein [Deltaproteobacteria bacterium]MBW1924105.1 DUF58 domain-containing protein [Deltaproteobacteria bacterium]MBW1950540.1 DUF58 domain-containing protein [Deltaproteobacteria bacterium]MBW2009644.1 DUF58 domain-containing protein [Deltaproteobacteria bacterium]MBW2102952.1 DUF58 domain-containing protein [Deltaproteobacteria bacterium]
MLPEALLSKIQSFHFKTKRQASDLFAGQYESAFKGRGIEFAEVREYQVGDDIRNIDWNVSARFGHPFVKVFHEERELTVLLLLDLSGSNRFGTRVKFKRELLAETAGILAFLAVRTNDKVGAVLFSSRVEKYVPPKKGPSHVWRLIKEIFTYEPADPGTDLAAAFDFLNRVAKRHAVVFLISDCRDLGFEKSMRLTARKHDLTILRLYDPAERELPEAGLVRLKDPETGRIVLVNTSNRRVREAWREAERRRQQALRTLAASAGVDFVELSTAGPLMEPMARLFDARRKRL